MYIFIQITFFKLVTNTPRYVLCYIGFFRPLPYVELFNLEPSSQAEVPQIDIDSFWHGSCPSLDI